MLNYKYWIGGIILLALLFFAYNNGSKIISRGIFKSKKQHFNSLFTQIDSLKGKRPEDALEVARIVQYKALQGRYTEELAWSLYWQSWIEIRQVGTEETGELALANAKLSYEKFHEIDDDYGIALSSDLIASCYFLLQKPDSAKNFLDIAEKATSNVHNNYSDSIFLVAEISNTKGVIEIEGPTAIKALHKSFELFSRIKHDEGVAKSAYNLATVYSYNRNFDQALQFLDIASKLYSYLGWERNVNDIRTEKGNFFYRLYDEEDDNQWFSNSKEFFQEAISTDSLHRCEKLYKIGKLYHLKAYWDSNRNQTEMAESIDSAYSYYQKALIKAGEEGNQFCLDLIDENLAALCKEKKDCYHLIPLLVASSQNINNIGKEVLKLQNSRIRELEKDEWEQQARIKQFWVNFWAGAILSLTIALSIVLFQRQKIAALRERLFFQMGMLRAQMNPHFISNSLTAIDALVNKGKNEDASNYLVKFSRLCRMILVHSENEKITLTEELEALEHFLVLEKLRMGPKLSYQISVSEEVHPQTVLVPPLIIQPFVENAIIHGLRKKKSPGTVQVIIEKAQPDSDRKQIICIVEDNGIGRELAKKLTSQSVFNSGSSEKKSRGIHLAKERIELIQKSKPAKISIIDLKNSDGKPSGTKVTIEIPIE